MEPMKGKWASSRVDLEYTELFCIPEVTSVFISSGDSVLGDTINLVFSGVPSRKSRLLTCLIGNKEFFCTQCRGITPHLSASGKSDGFSRGAAGS